MLHHAYLISGSRAEGIAHACVLHALSEEQLVGNPDVQVLSYGLFSIDDARSLQVWAGQKPVSLPQRVFVISIEQMLHEAQNALLKLFEEPPRESAFVLIVPNLERILPTLRSRFEIVTLTEVATHAHAESFLALPYAERLKEIAARTKEKDQVWIEALLASLEEYAHAKQDREAERALLFVREYISRRGASPKMLLEHLALVLQP